MICSRCHKEIVDGATFCTDCGASLTSEEPAIPVPQFPSFVPVSSETAPAMQPAMAPLPQPGMPQQAGYAAGASAFPYAFDESTYYHIDANEEYDFEAMRGICIALVVISTLSLVGILMPLPLAIAALVKACGGIGERNPYEKKNKFNSCRTWVIISIWILCFYVLLFCVVFIFASALGFSALPAQK